MEGTAHPQAERTRSGGIPHEPPGGTSGSRSGTAAPPCRCAQRRCGRRRRTPTATPPCSPSGPVTPTRLAAAAAQQQQHVVGVVHLLGAQPAIAVVPLAHPLPIQPLELRREYPVQIALGVAADGRIDRIQGDVGEVVQFCEKARSPAPTNVRASLARGEDFGLVQQHGARAHVERVELADPGGVVAARDGDAGPDFRNSPQSRSPRRGGSARCSDRRSSAVRNPGGLRAIWFSPAEIEAEGHYWSRWPG